MATSTKRRCAIYCRISKDDDGDGLGVERQRQDCERLAKRNGWKVVATFTDNDISAYSGKRRPEYRQLLDALAAKTVSALVVWHPDRLHRSPVELEEFIDVIEQTGAKVATVTAGEYDLTTPTGRMQARIVGAVARNESEHKAERLRRKHEELAASGKPHGGVRPFGYDASGMKIVKAEARIICELRDRLFAGESYRSMCLDLNGRGVTTAQGHVWHASNLRKMLTGPRLAALRVHQGEVLDGVAATWPAIISKDDHRRIVKISEARGGKVGRPPTYVLSGLLICGRCGEKLRSGGPGNGTRAWVCMRQAHDPEHRCGRLSVRADHLDALMEESIIDRLATARFAKQVTKTTKTKSTKRSPEDEVTRLSESIRQLRADYDDDLIDRATWLTSHKRLQERLEAARAQLTPDPNATTLAQFDGVKDVRRYWSKLTVDRKRAVAQALIDTVTIAPAARPTSTFDKTRVDVCWLA
jgi:DNA invertase Pin-like site-specific DNA recombinase